MRTDRSDDRVVRGARVECGSSNQPRDVDLFEIEWIAFTSTRGCCATIASASSPLEAV